MPKKNPDKKDPQLDEELQGFDIHINEFGEIVTNRPVDDLNEFLDDNVQDKKLKERNSEEE